MTGYAVDMQPHRKRVKHYEGSGHLHELTFSCYKRKPLLTNDVWRGILAKSLGQSCQDEGFDLIAFVFMPEHVHLLVRPKSTESKVSRLLARTKQPTSKGIKALLVEAGSSLVEKLTVQERPGKFCFRFWQEGPGFDRNIFSTDALSASIDYVHNNPVKRQLCRRATDWKWSSARFQMDGVHDPDLPPMIRPEPHWFDGSGTQIEHR
jgi:putative transposase